MNYTDEELQVFKRCFELVVEGCKTSSEMEAELRRTFWWVSNTTAYTLVRKWFRNREKIGELLAEQNVQATSEKDEREHKYQDGQHGEACPTSS